jgi:hypothetical protein
MDETVFVTLSAFVLIFIIMGMMPLKSKFFGLFPFFGALIAIYITTQLGSDGSLTTGYAGTTPILVSDWPMILVPIFLVFMGFLITLAKGLNRL